MSVQTQVTPGREAAHHRCWMCLQTGHSGRSLCYGAAWLLNLTVARFPVEPVSATVAEGLPGLHLRHMSHQLCLKWACLRANSWFTKAELFIYLFIYFPQVLPPGSGSTSVWDSFGFSRASKICAGCQHSQFRCHVLKRTTALTVALNQRSLNLMVCFQISHPHVNSLYSCRRVSQGSVTCTLLPQNFLQSVLILRDCFAFYDMNLTVTYITWQLFFYVC